MQTQAMTPEQATQIGFALNAALAHTGMQMSWSHARESWGYWVQVSPNKREFQKCDSLEAAVAACIEIYARRKHALYRDHTLLME